MGSAVAAAHLQLDLASVLRAAAQSEPDLDYEYDDATVLSNEEDALMSRGTVHSEGALTSRLDSTGYDSSCDTEPSAKQNTPEGELLSVHKHETRRQAEPATISEEPDVALANINEAEEIAVCSPSWRRDEKGRRVRPRSNLKWFDSW